MKQYSRGFTLLELLLSMALTTALVIMASNVYDTINKVGNRTLNINRDWVAQFFIRTQFESSDYSLNRYFSSVDLTTNRLSYITTKSARYGYNQKPVLVTYQYNSALRSLQYHEIDIPPWWDENQSQYMSQIDAWRLDTGKNSYRKSILNGIDNIDFEYWDTASKKWASQWNNKKILPNIVRITMHQSGIKREMILAAGALSLSTASGS